MELILNSNEHKVSDNCFRYYFKNNSRFINQNISLTNMILYNFFLNIYEKFKLTLKYDNNDIVINLQEGAYNASDISDIINLELKENNIDIEEPIKMIVDINQFKILIFRYIVHP